MKETPMSRQARQPRTTSRATGGWGIGALTALGLILATTLGAAPAPAPKPAPAEKPAPPATRPSLKDSPGWYYIVDPESASVALGRRTNAPLVKKPFTGGVKSLDELGRALCWSLHHSSRDSLSALCVTDAEFRDIMWKEFPQSRPITGLTWQDAWTSLDQRLKSGVAGALSDYGGDDWRFVRIQSDSSYQYKNFTLHMRVKLVAVNDQGAEVQMKWLRAVAERKGRFKIFSTDD